MPTQLDPSWLPGAEREHDIIIGGWMGTTKVSKEIKEITSSIIYRGTRGKGNSIETAPQVKIMKDGHSKLTSDDLLWYMRGMSKDEMWVLKEIKIKNDNIIMPRTTLSAKIQEAIDGIK